MRPPERNIIREQLAIIKNAKIVKIGRALNMVWITLNCKDGKIYALHLQTFFRFCSQDRVLITESDKYQPTVKLTLNPLFDSTVFNYDVQGVNLFDEWVTNIGASLLYNCRIENIVLNNFGDFTLYFDNKIILSVYIETTSDDECWRLFEWKSPQKHFVVRGNGIENMEE